MYLFPKIIKTDIPGHSIISASSCSTVHISELLNCIFQTMFTKLPLFIKDTNHALCLLDFFLADQTTFFHCDVFSLYIPIPYSCMHFRYFSKEDSAESKSTLVRVTELILALTLQRSAKSILARSAALLNAH